MTVQNEQPLIFADNTEYGICQFQGFLISGLDKNCGFEIQYKKPIGL